MAYPRQHVRCIVAGLTLLLCASAFALEQDRALSQLHHTSWTAKDGAPSQISALEQTTDGYLWIGSARGLFRFDGVRFELYTPPKGVTLPSHNTYALLATPDGGLWISFRPSGLGFLKDGKLTIYSRPDELPSSQVYAFAHDTSGRLWAGTHDGLVLRQGSRWVDVGADWNFVPERVHMMLTPRDGSLWVVSAKAIRVLKRGARHFELVETVAGQAGRLAEGPDGTIWISDFDHGVRPVGGATTPIQYAEALLVDRTGVVWVSTSLGGLRRIRPTRGKDGSPIIETFRVADGLAGDVALNFLEDREGNIWISSLRGLDRFRRAHFHAVALPSEQMRYTLAAGDNGAIWAGNASVQAISIVHPDDSVTSYPAAQMASVYRAADGTLYWGSNVGLWRRRDERWELLPFLREPEWPWEIFRDDDDPKAMWIGYGDAGLMHFRDGVLEKRKHPAGLPDIAPAASYHDPQGRIWLGYKGNRVGVVERGKLRWFTSANGIDIGRIRVIRGRGPHFWFGGELGLALYRDGRFTPVLLRNGERFGTVSGIIETADGSVWLNEMRGVAHIPAVEIRRLLRDPKHSIAFRRFDLLDGLPGAPQMNWTVSTALEGSDGRLWFSTDNGLAWIYPAQMTRNPLPPPVSIVSIASGDRQYDPTQKITFPIGTQSLEIHYTALSLSMPERVMFRYKLEGVDDEWQDAGTRREAFYTKLKPGTYRFRVIAANNDGVWNERGTSVEIELPPAFYQTTWFLIASVLAIGALLLLINSMRMRRVAARMQRLHDERLDERMRIAHELHDTLLQGVVSASMQLHVVDERLPADSPAKALVTNVVALIRRVADEGRQAVSGLRTGDDSALEQALARVKHDLDVEHAVDFRVIVTGRSRPLHPLMRDELYRIGREALVNAFRHADAHNVEVELEYRSAELTMRVRDDGRGIDPDVLHGGREGHWGLIGIRERAERIGARLRVSSRAGAGTEVELVVPGTAYLAGARRSTSRRVNPES
ncbi:MAG TPA: two-component regulator propeller domain-containing protein [Thermoanaerobaculia bacterium]